MVLLIIMIVIAVLLAAIIAGVVTYYAHNDDCSWWNELWVIVGAGVPMLFLLLGTFTKVHANEVGIIYDDRYGVVDTTLDEGFHKKSIFEHVTKISTLNRDKFVETSAQTDDGQYATFEISITYAVEGDDASVFFRKTGGEMKDDQLMALVEKDLQATTISYNIFDLLSEGLENARITFENKLRTSLSAEYGITLRFATFKDVDAGDEVESILKAKATAEQQIAIAVKQAEAALITAQNEAEVKKTLADAEAYAITVQGEATGKAASAYTDSILKMIDTLHENVPTMSYEECSKTILSIVFYNSWDGNLPEVLTSDSLSSMIGALISNN